MAAEASLTRAPPAGSATSRIPRRPLIRQSDLQLLADARAGSRRAFEVLVERHGSSLLRCCAALLPDGRAEDALQQGLLHAWIALQRGAQVHEPSGWLHRIVQNAALDILRRPGRPHVELDDSLPGDGDPAATFERRRRVREVLAQVAALPEAQREALLRTSVAGESHIRTASALGVSASAVRGLVYRARLALRTGAMALVPTPLLSWLPAWLRRGAALGTRLESVGSGDGAGAVATLVKGGMATVAVGAIAAGTAVGPTIGGGVAHHPSPDRARQRVVRAAEAGAAIGRTDLGTAVAGRVMLRQTADRTAVPFPRNDGGRERTRERSASGHSIGRPVGQRADDGGASGQSGAPQAAEGVSGDVSAAVGLSDGGNEPGADAGRREAASGHGDTAGSRAGDTPSTSGSGIDASAVGRADGETNGASHNSGAGSGETSGGASDTAAARGSSSRDGGSSPSSSDGGAPNSSSP
jgi:RNA polymerase sigma factor (sigma-70 family)